MLLPAALLGGMIRNITDASGITTKVEMKQEVRAEEPGLIEVEHLRNFDKFLKENDPSIAQQHNGLWDPCPLNKMPTCED
ncbi:MAG: hypothetical protein WAP51_03080 [Candidatus Sungiibacteriota bacterium]